jgi:autotransporter-associated beta strand protein
MQVTSYSSAAHDRFVSGFPSAPILNTDTLFVGLGKDWSGVAWTPNFVRKGFGFVSPDHYLVAQHFGGSSSLRTFDQTGNLQTRSQAKVEATGYGAVLNNSTGDLSIGTLVASMRNIKRYPVLDLNSSSSSDSSSYSGIGLLVYGHGGNETNSPRVGVSNFQYNPTFGGFANDGEFFLTSRNDIQLQSNDSGSPVFADWTNPDGTPELAVIGNHAAISETYNLHNFLGTNAIMQSLNSFMNDDGRSLRVVGNPSATWSGSQSININRNEAWGLGGNPNSPNNTNATVDKYVEMEPSSASSFTVSVSTNYNLRGIYFLSSANENDSFEFVTSNSSTLTLGRGGLTNYDNNLQIITAPLKLDRSQYWEGGPGGLSVVNLDTAGYFLEIGTLGETIISGNVSGAGGLALDKGTLKLSGTSTYTGSTWAHEGTLHISGDISSSSGLQIGTFASLTGTGSVPPLNGGGTISPGASPGILTVESIDPSGGMDFDFEFTVIGEPDFINAAASLNDLIRITSSTPFSTPLGAGNRVRIFFDAGNLASGQIFEGSFFTDTSTDFLSSIEDGIFEIYVADTGGNVDFGGQAYSLYAGTSAFLLSTEAQTADFGSGSVSGRIMRLTVLAPPAAPSAATASPLSDTEIRLDWTDNSGNEDGFRIERRSSGGSYAQIASVGANVISFNDAGLTAGTTYDYRITAFNAAGDSAPVETSGTTYSVIEDWRLEFFGSTANSGEAADGFDADFDSLVNLIEFVTGSDPTVFSPAPVDSSLLGSDGQISFDWRIGTGYDFSIGFSTDLTAGFTYYDSATLDAGSSPELEHIGTTAPVNELETRTYRVRDSVTAPQVFLRLQVN